MASSPQYCSRAGRCLMCTVAMVFIAAPGLTTQAAEGDGIALYRANGTALPVSQPPETDLAGRVVRDPLRGRIEYNTPALPEPEIPAADAAVPADLVPASSTPLTVRDEWFRAVYGVGIGATGLSAVDLEGDGPAEIVAGASSGGTYWYVLKHGPAGYYQHFVSSISATSITSVATADVTGDGRAEIVLGVGREIHIYSGTSYQLLKKITTSAGSSNGVRGIQVVDVDSDAALEFVFTDGNSLFIYNVASGAQEYTGSGYGRTPVSVGNVDADADLEIVANHTDGTGYVLNGRTRATEWNYPSGFGYYICTGDVDGDKIEEIVAGASWYKITILDADLKSPRYEITIDLDLDALKLADVEKDGRLDIVYGDGQWGAVYVHDGLTGALKWSTPNPEHGVTDVAIGDTDGDGVNELLWGAGYSSSGPDYLYVVDTATRQREWQSVDISGPFYAMDFGDVDNDGAPELLYGCYESESGYADGLFFIHDALSKTIEYQSPEPTRSNWTGLWRIRHANIDADPQAEIFLTTSTTYSGIIICYDGISHAEQWRFTIPSGLTFVSMDLGDVDNDGKLEVVAGTTRQHTGAPGLYLYVVDATTGKEEWHSVDLGSYWGSIMFLRLDQLDADPQLEMVIAASGEGLIILDGLTHLEQAHTSDLDTTALTTADLDGDGVREVVLGRVNGSLEARSVSGSLIKTIGTYGGQIDGLSVMNILGTGAPEFIFSVKNELLIYDGASPAGPPAWRSGAIGTNVARNDSLMAADIDGDGNVEIVLNVGTVGLRVYEVSSEQGACCIASAGTPGTGTCQVVAPHECNAMGGIYQGADTTCGPDTCDFCPDDPDKTTGGVCGCGVPDVDSDGDTVLDCNDLCPLDPAKTVPGVCGCFISDADTDSDTVADCIDNCPLLANLDQSDLDADDLGDVCDVCPHDPLDDLDADGVCGDVDTCPNSITAPTIVIGDCDSDVANRVVSGGCTMSDLIARAAFGARNHGQFVSAVAHLSTDWRQNGLISQDSHGRITSCAANAPIGKPGQ